MGEVQGSPAPPWSDLPSELLGLVFLHLPTRADRAFFHAVCRTWCSAARHCHLPPLSPLPWLLFPDGSATSFPHGETFQLPDGVRHHNSYGEWILLSGHDGSCFLMNHFTKATMPLPSLSSYSYYQEPVAGDLVENEEGWTWMEIKDTGLGVISVPSLVVCSTRLIAAILAVEGTGTIALCRPGAAAWSVSARMVCKYMLFSSMVFFQGKLYALDSNTNREVLIAIDIVDEHDSDEPRVSRIGFLIEGDYLLPRSISCPLYVHYYLVESHGTLLMIRRNLSYERRRYLLVARSNKCQLFVADFEQRLWAEVTTLGSQALFVGECYSRAVHVSPYDLSRDCIFFLDNCTGYWKTKATACELYDMKDENIYSPLPMVSQKSVKVPAAWIFSPG